VGLFFTIYETDAGNDLLDQFEACSRRQCFWASRPSLKTMALAALPSKKRFCCGELDAHYHPLHSDKIVFFWTWGEFSAWAGSHFFQFCWVKEMSGNNTDLLEAGLPDEIKIRPLLHSTPTHPAQVASKRDFTSQAGFWE
jgi:hypothetical protein